jgi:phage-related protein
MPLVDDAQNSNEKNNFPKVYICRNFFVSLHRRLLKMKKRFEVIFLEEVLDFLESLEYKHHEKILYNIDKAKVRTDPELFKKLTGEIWEFRTLYQGLQYRLLAFWDKTSVVDTLVISTHGFIKKQNKISDQEVEKALQTRTIYFKEKQSKK